MRRQRKHPDMPVDHPAPISVPSRPMQLRLLNLALGFLLTLGLLMLIHPIINIGAVLS